MGKHFKTGSKYFKDEVGIGKLRSKDREFSRLS